MSYERARSLPSHRVERQFGLLVGAVLAALGAWWLYRGRFGHAGIGLIGVGALLFLLGALLPRLLILPNRGWIALAHGLGWVMTRVVLTVVFVLVVTPIGVVKRAFGWDPLRRRAQRAGSYWVPYPERQRDSKHYENMF